MSTLSAPLPKATSRRLYGQVSFPGKATAVVGVRRSGKTTFLHQLRKERIETGVPRERLPYVNLEDERLDGLTAEHLGGVIEEYCRRRPSLRGTERVAWCFDEVQRISGWERFVRSCSTRSSWSSSSPVRRPTCSRARSRRRSGAARGPSPSTRSVSRRH